MTKILLFLLISIVISCIAKPHDPNDAMTSDNKELTSLFELTKKFLTNFKIDTEENLNDLNAKLDKLMEKIELHINSSEHEDAMKLPIPLTL
ncbi:hypothetical protein PVAND_015635 [Polypedilum vanderplanki]|uniref:Uncharacterized protein n=1 Tax=Polypedilum vanderplanki TaxID=319348 RepID=A0A9J6BDP3_POLVA|nr:hypothetical protein PVAND_015635 [Polypedilum vanderplanki]